MRIEDILFTTLRSEIRAEELNADIFQDLTEDEYKQLYVLSQQHDLTHIVASALLRSISLQNEEITSKFQKQIMLSLYRDGQKEYALDQLSNIFEEAKIPHIMLKGAIIRNLYPQTWMRTSCDIDILVPKGNVKTAIETLCNAGYIRLKDCSTHDYNFMSPNKVHIELHYTLTQEEGQLTASDKILDLVWESYVILIDGYTYRYNIIPEVFLIYHLAHMACHLVHGGCGVRPFIDLWLIKKYMIIDDEKLYSLLNQAKLLQFYKIAVDLSAVWLENRQHGEATKRLEAFILNGGVYGTTSNAAKVRAASGIGKMRSFFHLMFLPKENLEVIYPNLKKYPVLFPFYQIKRWFRYFDKNKRNKVKYLTEQRNTVTSDEMNETAFMLNQLGLI